MTLALTSARCASSSVGLLGRTRVRLAGRVLTVLLAAEVVAVVLIDLAGFTHPAGGHVDLSDLNPTSLVHYGFAGLGGGLSYVVACLVGFEETAGLAEDTRDGRRNVGRAVLIAVGFCGLLYAGSLLAQSVGEGPAAVAGVAADPASAFPFGLIVAAYGPAGRALADVANLLLVTSVFAALASFHTIVTRYLYAAGRDRVAPAVLGRVNPRNSSPSAASHLVSVVAAVVIVGFAVTGGDPFAGLFAWGSYVAAVGILALMIGTSVAVVGYFNRHSEHSPTTWVTVLAPTAAGLLMAGLWLVMVANSQTMIGAPRFGPLHLLLLGLPVVGAVVGLVRAAVLRRNELMWEDVAAPTPVELAAGTQVRFPLERKVPEYATDEAFRL